MKHTYNVIGMKCQSCVGKVQAALEAIPEIDQVNVSLEPPLVKVSMSTHVGTSDLNAALKKVGEYSVSEATESRNQEQSDQDINTSLISTYYPLILISVYLTGGVFLRAVTSANFDPISLMNNFMGGFFVVFSFFKILNLKGFADAYSTYDVIAKKFYNYGMVYPFIELALGILYFVGSLPYTTNIITAILMLVSSIGVIQALLKRSKIQCACLGTVFKLPMTKITLFEDSLMAGMAAVMLYVH